MERTIRCAPAFVFAMMSAVLALPLAIAQQPVPASPAPSPQPAGRGPGRGTPTPPPVVPKPEELAQIKEKTATDRSPCQRPQVQTRQPRTPGRCRSLCARRQDAPRISRHVRHASRHRPCLHGLDQGIERAKQLQSNQPQWNQGKKQIHAYNSEIDGAVLPYGVTLPENYDPAKPTRLYVWLHGRQNNTTEAEFIYGFLNRTAAGNRSRRRPRTDPARLLRPHQWRRLALGRRNGRLRVHRRREEALQHRRQAHHPPRILAGRRRRLAYLAASSGPLRRRRNRRRHRLAHARSSPA